MNNRELALLILGLVIGLTVSWLGNKFDVLPVVYGLLFVFVVLFGVYFFCAWFSKGIDKALSRSRLWKDPHDASQTPFSIDEY